MPIDYNALQEQVRREVSAALEAASQAGAEAFDENVARGSRSGMHYRGNPAQSSAPGEYPQEQLGDYRRSIAAVPVSWNFHVFGPISDPPEHAFWLEVLPPQDGGRAPVRHTGEDPRTRERILEALRALYP